MCEILLWVTDKAPPDPDPKRDALLYKRGHVITVQQDGWPWSKEELAKPEWVVVKVPGAAIEDYHAFLYPQYQPGLFLEDEPKLLALRGRAFDLDSVPALAKLDGKKSVPSVVVERRALEAASVAVDAPAVEPVIPVIG